MRLVARYRAAIIVVAALSGLLAGCTSRPAPPVQVGDQILVVHRGGDRHTFGERKHCGGTGDFDSRAVLEVRLPWVLLENPRDGGLNVWTNLEHVSFAVCPR
jgi:hypothetical protein